MNIFFDVTSMPKVEIYSINYDFMPTIPYAAKTMWVQLAFPVKDLVTGDQAHIVSTEKDFVPPQGPFEVIDVIGTRVMLQAPPYLKEGQWGYATRYFSDPSCSHKNWVYGRGNPVGYLVY